MRLLDWLWGSYGTVIVHIGFDDGSTRWESWTYSKARETFGDTFGEPKP
jgi:hypothetical protein